MAKSSESTRENSTPVLGCQEGKASTDVLKDRGPFEDGEELAVSGSIGAIGSESSPTPSRGSLVSGALQGLAILQNLEMTCQGQVAGACQEPPWGVVVVLSLVKNDVKR